MRTGTRTASLAMAAIVIGGCVASEPVPDSGVCPPGLTYSCTSSVGKTQRCICATREDLKQILDPVNKN